jgi:hypothetical protein
MLRTFAVLLLLLGLATATPVVCLCAPTQMAGLMAGVRQTDQDGAILQTDRTGLSEQEPSGPSLLATSAAAVVASLIATAAGLPSGTPWRLPLPLVARTYPALLRIPAGPARAPTVPPPR